VACGVAVNSTVSVIVTRAGDVGVAVARDRGVGVAASNGAAGGITVITRVMTEAASSGLITFSAVNMPIPTNAPTAARQQQQRINATAINTMSQVRFCDCIEILS